MSQNQVITLVNTLKNRPFVCEYSGSHFKASDKGITFNGMDKDGNQLPARKKPIRQWVLSVLRVYCAV